MGRAHANNHPLFYYGNQKADAIYTLSISLLKGLEHTSTNIGSEEEVQVANIPMTEINIHKYRSTSGLVKEYRLPWTRHMTNMMAKTLTTQ